MMCLRLTLTLALLAGMAAIILGGCSDGTKSGKDDGGAQTEPATAAVRVGVLKIEPHRVVVYDELPGRVSARQTAEIRPQVSGIVRSVLFKEGTEVSADQPLFQIDPAPFVADVEAASAVLARAEADLANAAVKHQRVEALAAREATSAAALGDAKAALAQARANVAEAEANLTRRKLEVSYATVRSPIRGRIGQALATEGSLASVGASAALAVVQQIDTVYLDVRQSSVQWAALAEGVETDRAAGSPAARVEILTITGRPYEFPGTVLFSDSTVDPGTGSIAMRLEVPNPHRQLLPGMFLRARVPSAIYSDALGVPQQAVRRDAAGSAYLTILGSDNTASRRDVALGPLVDGRYLILSGLKAGETVVVSGQERTDAGQPLQPVTYEPTASAPEI
jgi:multidrug efflux system membrane fusion protein